MEEFYKKTYAKNLDSGKAIEGSADLRRADVSGDMNKLYHSLE